MATFSGAIALLTKTFSTVIPSSNGVIGAGTVIYTAAVGKKTIVNLTNFFGGVLTASGTVAFVIQRKDPQSGAYVNSGITFTCTGAGSANSPGTLSMDQAGVQSIVNNGVGEFNGDSPSASGNARIVLMPEDRIVTVSGSTADGNSNFRICGRVEEYYSSL